MAYRRFHDPKICPRLVRRQIGEAVLHALLWPIEAASWRGHARVLFGDTYPNNHAFRSAVYRLRRAGLIVQCGGRMALTDTGLDRLPLACRPERFWKRRWNGLWYVLVYDVPESNRRYRDILRGFLKRLRMGCLQKSVYVTPDDIRPEFLDLDQTIAVHGYAFLFEAETVLNYGPELVVSAAWDFDLLQREHRFYLDTCEANLCMLDARKLKRAEISALGIEEMNAYLHVMRNDPLLPEPLLPSTYLGRDVYAMHCRFYAAIARHIASRFISTIVSSQRDVL
jgi:phenylacetic acid degradation operon negative regulatory protein